MEHWNDRENKELYQMNRTKRITAVVLLAIVFGTAFFTGCNGKTVEQTQYPILKSKLELYLKDPANVTYADIESVYMVNKVMGMNMSMGPSDPRYRGVLTLKEEAGEDYFGAHTWKNYSGSLPSFVNIDTTPFSSDTWYEYDDVDFDFFQNCQINSFLFNGKDKILFDISTF